MSWWQHNKSFGDDIAFSSIHLILGDAFHRCLPRMEADDLLEPFPTEIEAFACLIA
jgi:hypothetical protein